MICTNHLRCLGFEAHVTQRHFLRHTSILAIDKPSTLYIAAPSAIPWHTGHTPHGPVHEGVAIRSRERHLIADAEVAGIDAALDAHHGGRELGVAAVQMPQQAAHARRDAAPCQCGLLRDDAVPYGRQ